MFEGKRQRVWLLVCTALAITSLKTLALASSSDDNHYDLQTFGSSINDNTYPNHFTINDIAEKSGDKKTSPFENPQDFFVKAQALVAAASVSLVDWVDHQSTISNPRNPYNRINQFGGWRKDPTNKSCLDVRGLVLSRTSEVPVTTKPSADRCVVISGRWTDPYSGEVFHRPYPDIEIDHLVALKNAYLMGASKWSQKKRCWYANFYKNSYHLIPVAARQNERKGDATPFDYMPPKENYQCAYIKNWLKTKLLWKLAMVPPETEAIERLIKRHNCSKASLKISEKELLQGRADIEAGSPYCNSFAD